VTGPITVGVQVGGVTDRGMLGELARVVEANGFDAFYVSDHPGVSPSPFATLAAAATVTSTVRLGTYVCNTGVREPVQLASDAATVDVWSGGRFIFGVGAGHTPVEWTMEGRSYPSAANRVGRFAEVLSVVVGLLAGEVVTFDGQFVHVREACLLSPRPVRSRVPILVGGNGKRLLAETARVADVVSLTGLTRTLDDGHRHEADWSARAIDERVEVVHRTNANAVLDALVQVVAITDDPLAAAEQIAPTVPGLEPEHVLAAPFALLGSVESIAENLLEYHERWGITSYVVRDTAIETMSAVIARLNA
jgi:probable F420-dependent oxidoreductase